MAQIIPPITTLPEGTGTAPSVEDIQDRLPSICVDYLSHNWTEEDVWASWRNMTRHKHEIANGVRLENASWRTWNKQRNKLRTISPETLNWLKDSDVTWLYGPLHTAAVEPVRPLRVAPVDDRLGIDHPTGMKPGILKHRTLSELLTMPGHSSPVLEATIPEEEADELNGSKRPSLSHTRSDIGLNRSNSVPTRRRPREDTLVSAMHRNANHSEETEDKERSPDRPPGVKRHISFNTFVEQVIALEEPLVSPKPTFEEDSEDDDMLEMRSNRTGRSSSVTSYGSTGGNMTIAKIAPAMLKTAGSFTNNPKLPRMVYQPTNEYLSPQHEVPPAITSPFEIPSPMGQPPVGGRWKVPTADEDGYSGIGMDYFGGPDLTGSSPNAAAAAATVPGSQFVRAPPAVQQPPVQPKWRQQAAAASPATSAEVTGSSPSASTSSSSLNANANVVMNNAVLSPQPGRSILKVRSSVPSVPVPEPVSPPAIFNYNPSVATGIGGMYGSYDESKVVIPSPTQAGNEPERGREHRGRSTSRGQGSSLSDRGVANVRGSSSSSSGSVSRSPVETPVSKIARGRDPQSDSSSSKSITPTASAASAVPGQEPMDVDYEPERSSTPTPHSSPQIVFRPIKDTSPATLPHNSSSSPAARGRGRDCSPRPAPGTTAVSASGPGPGADPAAYSSTVRQPAPAPVNISTSGTSGSPSPSPSQSQPSATVAHNPINAEPTLSQPGLAPSGSDDDDGSTLIGRATNIANTAKDLLGALWYGQDGSRPVTPTRVHRRGASLG